MKYEIDRRALLRMGAAATFVAGAQAFVGIPALADYAAGPALRRNAFTMAANDPVLRGYRKAIQAMRALPDTNPCSWFYQAAIHGTTDPRGLTAWNTCHIDSSFFWAWHRMYLDWFERIVRKYSGMYDWAIPYWDWTNPAQRALPQPFRVQGNTLYDATRNSAVNAGASLSTSLATSVANAMTLLDYFSTQSSVNGPHGSVHVSVGGNMGSIYTAAQDPIFWAHHSQVDRLWNLWLAQGGGRSSPVGNATWRNTTYTFFDECCQAVTMKGCDIIRAAQQLSYTYEGEPPQVQQYCPIAWIPVLAELKSLVVWQPRTVLSGKPVRVPLAPAAERESLGKQLHAFAPAPRQNAFLQIKGIEAETQPGISWEVYVGPRGFRPVPQSPYFVGIFALFSAGLKTRKEHYRPAEFAFPLGRVLEAAPDPANLEVVYVPSSGLETKEPMLEKLDVRSRLTVGEMSVAVDTAMPQPPAEEQDRLRREEEQK
ncbi:MAG TPA: tyrosinase family protein [Sphingomonadales bacterium]|nr:tyrosinase family protein [Sphingomonadales bacterium]